MPSGFWDAFGIPLLITAACLYYMYRLLVLKDVKSVRSKTKRELKGAEKDAFCKEAARLLAFFAAGSVLAVLSAFINPAMTLLLILAVVAYEVMQWKKLDEKYR